MTTEKKVTYWVESSDEDLKIAETMLKNKYRLYTGLNKQNIYNNG